MHMAKRTEAESFGERLKRLRVSLNLTQRELASRASVSAGLIWQYESGLIVSPTGTTAEKLARPLNVSPGELLYGKRGNASVNSKGAM